MATACGGVRIRGVLSVLALWAISTLCSAGECEDAASRFSGEKTAGAITLKSGQTIEGVRVVGFTPIDYIVEVYDGIFIRLPRGQVVSVRTEGQEEVASPRETNGESGVPAVLLPGRRISPRFNVRLNSTVVEETVEYEETDFLAILEDIEQHTGASFEVAPELEELPGEDREWRVTINPGDTLLMVLREEFAPAFPGIDVVYGYDHILLRPADVRQDDPPPSEEPDGPALNEPE